jgi:hypothetical protein
LERLKQVNSDFIHDIKTYLNVTNQKLTSFETDHYDRYWKMLSLYGKMSQWHVYDPFQHYQQLAPNLSIWRRPKLLGQRLLVRNNQSQKYDLLS